MVNGLLDTADRYLRSSQSRTRAAPAKEALIRDAAELSSWAYRCLALLKGAGLDELPYPIVGPLQAWFTDLGVRTDTIFRAELLENYELRSIDDIHFKGVRNPAPSLSTIVADITWPILRVTVPAKALGISTHFAIVAHELGHALFDRINWDLSPIAADLDNLKLTVAHRLGKATIDADTFKFLLEVFRDWFQEFACDAVALLLTGPAFFFSLGDFFQLRPGGYGVSKTHPASDLRRRLLHDKLYGGGHASFASVFRKHTDHVLTDDFNSPLIRRVPDASTIFTYAKSLSGTGGRNLYKDDEAHVLAELHDFMPIVSPLIFSHAENYLTAIPRNAVYTAVQYDADLTAHMKSLLLAIPPIEAGIKLDEKRPADFA